MSARFEAQRQVEEAVRAAETQWRLSIADPSERDRFVDRELRERLEESLTAVVPLEARIAVLREAIHDAADVVSDIELEDFETQLERASSAAEPEKWPELVGELVTALADRVREQSDELKRMRSEAEAAPAVTLARPGGRRPRSKVGATTLALPFLAAANDESLVLRDIPPSPIGPVKASG